MSTLATNGKTKGNPRGSGYQRAERDLYVEPEWAVEALIDSEDAMIGLEPDAFPEPIWDPACGTGTIPRVFNRRGFLSYGTDLATGHDFLDRSFYPPELFGSLVCNPPFKSAEAFIERALDPGLGLEVAAFLLRLAFLEGQERRKMFERTPLARVLVFSKRVSMPPPGTKQVGGAVAFAWFVWRRGHVGPPTIGWLP